VAGSSCTILSPSTPQDMHGLGSPCWLSPSLPQLAMSAPVQHRLLLPCHTVKLLTSAEWKDNRFGSGSQPPSLDPPFRCLRSWTSPARENRIASATQPWPAEKELALGSSRCDGPSQVRRPPAKARRFVASGVLLPPPPCPSPASAQPRERRF